METKYTPGPWHVEKPFQEIGVYVSTKSTALVARIEPDAGYRIEANARLIAAAPELLDSLQELSEWMRTHCGPSDGTHEMLCRAVERIQKAGGDVR